jgi:LysM repeat protein
MARIRLSRDKTDPVRDPAANHPGHTPTFRGLTERQWFISALVVSGLLLLIAFRGCIVPSGVGPKTPVGSVPSAAPASSAPQPGGTYTVKSGDTLSKIAQENGTTVQALAAANGIDLNSRVILRVGQQLQIPK